MRKEGGRRIDANRHALAHDAVRRPREAEIGEDADQRPFLSARLDPPAEPGPPVSHHDGGGRDIELEGRADWTVRVDIDANIPSPASVSPSIHATRRSTAARVRPGNALVTASLRGSTRITDGSS
jgi:hypothetical protein